MKFELGKKYEQNEKNKVRSITSSILVTIQQLLIVLVVVAISLGITIVVNTLAFVGIILAVLAVFVCSSIINKSVENHRISDIKTFKISLILQYLFVINTSVIFIVATVMANYEIHTYITDYNLNFSDNIGLLIANVSNGLSLGALTIPSALIIVILVFLFFFILTQMILLDYDGAIYIKKDDNVYYPALAYTLKGDASPVKVVDYEYLKKLTIDEDDFITSDSRYFDFYIYGEEEKYFHIETFATTSKNGKLIKSKSITSEIYEYDIELFV